jgi:hypothetical protein
MSFGSKIMMEYLKLNSIKTALWTFKCNHSERNEKFLVQELVYCNYKNKSMFSIDLRGYIPKTKWKEFKQHLRQLATQQSEEIVDVSFSQSLLNEDLFEIKIAFNDKKSMFSFLQSDQYTLISGSFRTLGMLRDKNIRQYTQVTMK